MIPLKKVIEIITKHAKLEKELSSGEIEKKKFALKSKEYSELSDIVNIAKEYERYEESKKGLINIIEDSNVEKDIKDLAKAELDELDKNNILNEKKLKLFLLPKDEADTKNAIIEIRAGTGGLEASLFANDLFKMYEKISNKKNGI